VTALPSVITIGIDPTIELGPVTIAWHGLTIAIGIACCSSPSPSPARGYPSPAGRRCVQTRRHRRARSIAESRPRGT
jgi:hypothetical protein